MVLDEVLVGRGRGRGRGGRGRREADPGPDPEPEGSAHRLLASLAPGATAFNSSAPLAGAAVTAGLILVARRLPRRTVLSRGY